MSAFDNMPDVGKKKVKVQQPPPQKRMPVLLAALAGLVLLLLCLMLAGIGAWYFTLGPGASPQKVGVAVPPGSAPTTPGASSAANTQGVKIAYSVYTGDSPEGHSIWVMNADGSDAKQVIRTASSPAFSPDGKQIVYYHYTDGIYVANADGTGAHKILGETNAKYLAWSHDGKWIAFASKPNANKDNGNINIDAIRVDGSGRRTIVIGGSMPAWSPNDQQIAFSDCRGSDCGILTAGSLGGDEGTMIVKELGTNPAWSPNGNKIVFQADVDSIKQLFVVNVDGTGKKQLTSGTSPHVGAAWSPDGNTIFYRSPQGGNWGIWKMDADGSGQVKLISNVEPVDWAYERLAVAP